MDETMDLHRIRLCKKMMSMPPFFLCSELHTWHSLRFAIYTIQNSSRLSNLLVFIASNTA